VTTYVALLRAVNVGGTGKLPMSDLKALCHEAGFHDTRTYIASGNVVFRSDAGESEVRQALEHRLHAYAGKPVDVIVRSGAEMAAVLTRNPFPDKDPKFVVAIFLDHAPAPDLPDHLTGQAEEQVRLGAREVYVWYPTGQGRSRLRVPGAEHGTARNINTVAKLARMAGGF